MRAELPMIPRETQFLAGSPPDVEEDPFRLSMRARFVFAAIRRRKLLVATVFLLIVAGSVAALRLLPKTYHVETRLLAQGPGAMPAAVRQGNEADEAPTKSAFDLVHRHDNLLLLIKQTNLFVAQSEAHKPSLREWLGLPPLGLLQNFSSVEDPLNLLVTKLDKALAVTTGEGTVTIAIDWPDPLQAYQIVGAALQNFIESRHLREITAIDEMISLLEGRAASLHQALQTEQEEVARERALSSGTSANLPRARKRGEGEELAELKSMLEAKQRAIKDVEEFRRRRLADLQAQLDEKRGVYSDAYPSIVNLQQDIAALSKQSPQVAQLRQEAREIAAKIVVQEREKQPAEERPLDRQSTHAVHAVPPETTEQTERVRDARFKYERMVERLNQVQLQLDAARAAFKYRYVVVWPAEVPKKPTSPKPHLVLGAGFFLALVLSALVATLAELRAGVLFENWQVEERLGIPVLAEVGTQ